MNIQPQSRAVTASSAAPLIRQTLGAPWPWTDELLLLSGADRAELVQQVRHLQAWANDPAHHHPGALTDLAFELNCQRLWKPCRLAVVTGNLSELPARLERVALRLENADCRQIRDVSGIYFTAEPLAAQGTVALLTPGEGAQYLGMLRELPGHFPALQACLEQCDQLSANSDARRISEFLRFGTPDSLPHQDALEDELRAMTNTMCSVLVADWLVHLVLLELGLQGDVAAGHSMGELAALCSSGCIEDQSFALDLSAKMAQTMTEQDGTNEDFVLLAVGASKSRMQHLIEQGESDGALSAGSVLVAMDNCPHQAVLVAPESLASGIVGLLEAERVVFERLPFGRPYHTDKFRPSLVPLQKFFEQIQFQSPERTIYSCTTARPFPADPDEIRRLAVEHWATPVAFTEMIENMYADGVRVFVEAGPRGNLTSFVEDILRGRPMLAVPSDTQRRSSLTQLNHLVGQLAVHGVPLDLNSLYKLRSPAATTWEGVPHPSTESTPPPEPTPQPVPESSELPMGPWSEEDLVVHEYLGVMENFLQTQQRVMAEFFQAESIAPSAPGELDQLPSNPTPIVQQHAPPENALHTTNGHAPPHTEQFAPSQPAGNADAVADVGMTQPLIGQVIKHTLDEEIVMHRVLDLGEDLFALDHTIGGRNVSQVDPHQHGLPVMPMTFTLEMMSEVSRLLAPGKVVVAIENVQLAKWLAYEDAARPITVEVSAKRLPQATSTGGIKLSLKVQDLGPRDDAGNLVDKPTTAASATVLLEETYPTAPVADELQLADERECRISIFELYRSLFHGERLMGVQQLTRYGTQGIEGVIQVLERDNLLASQRDPQFSADPVLMDVMMHPLVAWHLEQPSQQGRVSVPFAVQRVEFYGPPPAVGMSLVARGWMQHETPRQFKHSVEVLGSDGRPLYRLSGGRYWRFYLPVAEINFNGPKDQYFISEPWPAARPSDAAAEGLEIGVCRLTPPEDVRDSAMRLPAARVTMAPSELAEFLALDVPNTERVDWLFGRIAAKDAVRIVWNERYGERLFPADILIGHDSQGRPVASLRNGATPTDFPNVSVSHSHGIMAALAAIHRYVGIGLKKVEPRDAPFVNQAFTRDEQNLLGQSDLPTDDLATRFLCAKEAVRNALGRALSEAPHSLAVCWMNRPGNLLGVQLGDALSQQYPLLAGRTLAVTVHRDKEMIVATTLCEPLHG